MNYLDNMGVPQEQLAKYRQKIFVRRLSIQTLVDYIKKELHKRAKKHDTSKSTGVEKEVLSKYVDRFPNIWGIGNSAQSYPNDYKAALTVHAKNNDYVPGYFEQGMSGMTVIQLTEMICDIVVSAKEQSWTTDKLVAFLRSDFRKYHETISDPVIDIICNSVPELMEIL